MKRAELLEATELASWKALRGDELRRALSAQQDVKREL